MWPAIPGALAASFNPISSMLPGAVGLQSDPPVTAMAEYDVSFRIDGWEPLEKIAFGHAQVASGNAAIQLPADERMWIRFSPSWRSAWR